MSDVVEYIKPGRSLEGDLIEVYSSPESLPLGDSPTLLRGETILGYFHGTGDDFYVATVQFRSWEVDGEGERYGEIHIWKCSDRSERYKLWSNLGKSQTMSDLIPWMANK